MKLTGFVRLSRAICFTYILRICHSGNVFMHYLYIPKCIKRTFFFTIKRGLIIQKPVLLISTEYFELMYRSFHHKVYQNKLLMN